MTAAALFAGIGGLASVFANGGIQTEVMVKNWQPAKVVLAAQFPKTELLDDVAHVKTLPRVDILTAWISLLVLGAKCCRPARNIPELRGAQARVTPPLILGE